MLANDLIGGGVRDGTITLKTRGGDDRSGLDYTFAAVAGAGDAK